MCTFCYDHSFMLTLNSAFFYVGFAKFRLLHMCHLETLEMEFRRKIYTSVFNHQKLESAIDKKELNITLITELRAIINDINSRKGYLHLYWYNLKYFVHTLHGAYRLLYKILHTFSDSSIHKKFQHHDLVYGPRPIADNFKMFTSLIDFIDLQLAYIETLLKFRLNVEMHDTVMRLLHQLIKFFDKLYGLMIILG